MRKGWLGLVVVVLLIVGYVAIQHKVEREYRALIASTNDLTKEAGFTLDIQAYEYRFFGARAEVAVVAGRLPELEQILAQIRLESLMSYGPFLRYDDELRFGLLHSRDRLMTEAMGDELADMVTRLFGDRPPVEGETVLGFGGDAQYWVRVNPANMAEPPAELDFEGLLMRGHVDLASFVGGYTLSGGGTRVETPTSSFSLGSLEGRMEITSIVAGTPLGKTDLTLNDVRISTLVIPETHTTLRLLSDTTSVDDLLNSEVTLLADPFQTAALEGSPFATVDRLALGLTLRELGTQGWSELDALMTRLNELELATFSEDVDIAEQAVADMPGVLDSLVAVAAEQVLRPGRSSMTLTGSAGAQGVELANIETWYGYVGLPDGVATLEDLSALAEEQWLRVMDFQMDAYLHASVIDQFSEEQQTVLAELMENGEASVVMRDGHLTFNGEEMPVDALLAVISQYTAGLRGAPLDGGDEVSAVFGSLATAVSLGVEEYFYEHQRLPSLAQVADMTAAYADEAGLTARLHDFDTVEGVLDLVLEDELGTGVALRMIPGMPNLSEHNWIQWNCQYSVRDAERYQLWFVANCETLQPVPSLL